MPGHLAGEHTRDCHVMYANRLNSRRETMRNPGPGAWSDMGGGEPGLRYALTKRRSACVWFGLLCLRAERRAKPYHAQRSWIVVAGATHACVRSYVESACS